MADLAGAGHDLDATAVVIHTSGTTSAPRPVELTYGNLLWSALGSASALGLDPGERWLCALPVSHVGGLSILLRSCIYGTTAVIHEHFDTERVLQALGKEDITLVSLVSTTLARLLDAGLERPPALRAALTGGGPRSGGARRSSARRGGARQPHLRAHRGLLAGHDRAARGYGLPSESCRPTPVLHARARRGRAAGGPSGRGDHGRFTDRRARIARPRWLAAHRRSGRPGRARPVAHHRAQGSARRPRRRPRLREKRGHPLFAPPTSRRGLVRAHGGTGRFPPSGGNLRKPGMAISGRACPCLGHSRHQAGRSGPAQNDQQGQAECGRCRVACQVHQWGRGSRTDRRGNGTGPILLSQATFLLAHIANSGPVPLAVLTPVPLPLRFILPIADLSRLPLRFILPITRTCPACRSLSPLAGSPLAAPLGFRSSAAVIASSWASHPT